MSTQITTAFVEQYSANVLQLSQQRGSRLRAAVHVEPVTGKNAFIDRIGAVAARRRTSRHADTPQLDTPHSRRRVSLVDYDWADLIDDADNGGRLTMFEMIVPERAKVPAAHYHRDFEEVWYGVDGTLTVTLDGVAHELKSGDALFVPRGAVHRFDNLSAGDARTLITLTPATAGKRYFEDIASVMNVGGPPDMAKVKAVMERYGLIAA